MSDNTLFFDMPSLDTLFEMPPLENHSDTETDEDEEEDEQASKYQKTEDAPSTVMVCRYCDKESAILSVITGMCRDCVDFNIRMAGYQLWYCFHCGESRTAEKDAKVPMYCKTCGPNFYGPVFYDIGPHPEKPIDVAPPCLYPHKQCESRFSKGWWTENGGYCRNHVDWAAKERVE